MEKLPELIRTDLSGLTLAFGKTTYVFHANEPALGARSTDLYKIRCFGGGGSAIRVGHQKIGAFGSCHAVLPG